MGKVYAQLGDAGLGNKLFVWAKALVFARINQMEMSTSRWWDFHPGVYLRNLKKQQRDHRFYWVLFQTESAGKKMRFIFYKICCKKVKNPPLAPYSKSRNTLFVFDQCPKSDYFSDIQSFRDLIKQELYMKTAKSCQLRIDAADAPVIGVHIRRGDFIETMRTSLSAFKTMIGQIRAFTGKNVPATIFSDGYDGDLADILSMENVSRADWNSPIVDMFILAKSKIIITSNYSTFSYWSGFLSDAVILKQHGDLSSKIRPDDMNNEIYEGCLPGDTSCWSNLLKKNLSELI